MASFPGASNVRNLKPVHPPGHQLSVDAGQGVAAHPYPHQLQLGLLLPQICKDCLRSQLCCSQNHRTCLRLRVSPVKPFSDKTLGAMDAFYVANKPEHLTNTILELVPKVCCGLAFWPVMIFLAVNLVYRKKGHFVKTLHPPGRTVFLSWRERQSSWCSLLLACPLQ